jgi:replicative DNA helicase
MATSMFDRAPPFDSEAEIGVLGSIMLLPEACDDVAPLLRATDFHEDAHRKIYRHMLAMHEAGRKIDPTLLVDKLNTAGEYDSVGGAAYLGKILHAVPNAAHAKFYAEIVARNSLLRRAIDLSTETLRQCYAHDADPVALLGKLESEALEIIADGTAATDAADLALTVDGVLSEIESRMRHESRPGVQTGFRALDDMLGGFKPGQLITLAGRPGMGKSALAKNIAMNVADRGERVYFASLEMSAAELTERALSAWARVSSYDLQKGALSEAQRDRVIKTAGRIAQLPIDIHDSAGQRVVQIAATARRLKRQKNLKLIVIDYLQLVDPDNPRDVREQQVARMTRQLKGLARDLAVPILCLAQLNRNAESAGKVGVRPSLGMLRESGAIEQDSDVVIFAHRPHYYTDRTPPAQGESEEAEIVVAKQRGGRYGVCKVAWTGAYFRFDNLADEWDEGFSEPAEQQLELEDFHKR